MLKRLTASVTTSRSFAAFVGLLERLDREGRDLLRVLTYHRVERGDVHPAPSPAITVSPDAFADQMNFVRGHYEAISVEQVLHAVRVGARLPRRSVLITFDDGYRDFRSQAWPVLKELALPVVLFVPTAFPGEAPEAFWWDRLHHALLNTPRRDRLETPVGRLPLGTTRERARASAQLQTHLKRMPHADAIVWVTANCRQLEVPPLPPTMLGWDELRELAREGVTIASHTRTHPLLTRIPPEEVRAEVAGALRDLERELGTVQPILAYPAGAFDEGVVRIVAEEGHILAFTTVRGVNDLAQAHPLKLRRINVGPRASLGLLRGQLLGRSAGLNRFFPLSVPGETSPA